MKTRNLLLAAFACGLAILLAGGLKLFLVANDSAASKTLDVGVTGQAADVAVTVNRVTETGDEMTVEVTLVGADDVDGATTFWLVVAGGRITPSASTRPSACAATQQAVSTTCTLTFDVREAQGTGRILIYERAGERLRWQLASAPPGD